MIQAKEGRTEAYTREELLRARAADPGPTAPIRGSAAGFVRRPEWHERAACRGAGPTMFFPEIGENARIAKRVCRGCPVRDLCEEYVTGLGGLQADYGIWGGKSPRERQVERRGGTLVVYHDHCQVCSAELFGRQRSVCSDECRKLRGAALERDRRRSVQ
jgi:predicted nucleic acid-binding Zn ribbon protein